jgi:hypothetical protein
VVDQRVGAHQPRVRAAGDPVAPAHRGDHLGLLLRPTHEQHPFGAVVLGQVFMQHVVLALTLGEVHQRQVMGGDEVV